jgi:hypothetical protein
VRPAPRFPSCRRRREDGRRRRPPAGPALKGVEKSLPAPSTARTRRCGTPCMLRSRSAPSHRWSSWPLALTLRRPGRRRRRPTEVRPQVGHDVDRGLGGAILSRPCPLLALADDHNPAALAQRLGGRLGLVAPHDYGEEPPTPAHADLVRRLELEPRTLPKRANRPIPRPAARGRTRQSTRPFTCRDYPLLTRGRCRSVPPVCPTSSGQRGSSLREAGTTTLVNIRE